MPVQDALCMVQARALESLWKDDEREEFEGWMTCSWEQAVQFVQAKGEEDAADRLMAARMIGLG